MLILPSEVSRFFRDKYDGRRSFYCVDDSGDLYRLLPSGDVYVHWCQEGPVKYTEKGAKVGNIKSPPNKGR